MNAQQNPVQSIDSRESGPLPTKVKAQPPEKGCRNLVHKYALVAAGYGTLPLHISQAVLDLHVLPQLQSEILLRFGICVEQLTASRQELVLLRELSKSAGRKAVNRRFAPVIVKKLVRGGLFSTKHAAPIASAAVGATYNLLQVQWFGHRLIGECLKVTNRKGAGN